MSAPLPPGSRLPAAGRSAADAAPPPRRTRTTGTGPTLRRLALAVALFLALSAWRLHDYYPPLPNPLAFELTLAPGTPGRSDPVIVAGETGRGDFLAVRFAAADIVHFVHDSWGFPGLQSEPVKLPPDRRLRLRVAMPSLDQIQGGRAPDTNRLRVEVDGRVVLDRDVHHYVRAPHRIYLGLNPLGGTACGEALHGRITLADGREVRGAASAILTRRQRIQAWLTQLPSQAVALLLLSLVAAFNLHRLDPALARLRRLPGLVARHRTFAAAGAVSTVVFAWMVTLGSFQFNHADVFASFYDYQAASFLQGRLDVPEDAIGGEAFEARGKLYGYFGPTPALLRVPFALTGFGFGKLTRGFMLAYFVATLLAAYLLLLELTRFARGSTPAESSPVAPPPPFATLVLTLSVGLGSTVFFLGSRAIIFHEAILCGIVFALWSSWCAVRHWESPAPRRWLLALAFALLSLHARPPTGLFALVFLGCVALAIAARDWPRQRSAALRPALLVGTLCLAGLFTLHGFAWLKFRVFDPAPLRISRPYLGTDRLHHVGGKSFHLVNLPHNFYAYVARPNLQFTPNFPWILHGPPLPPDWFANAKIDLPDHTVPPTYASPSLFVLATLGTLVAFARRPPLRPLVLCAWSAALPVAVALFAAIATAQRYTGDFCPPLVLGAATALAGLHATPPRPRPFVQALLVALTTASLIVTFALTLHYQRAVVWGVPDDVRQAYQQVAQRIDTLLGVPPRKP